MSCQHHLRKSAPSAYVILRTKLAPYLSAIREIDRSGGGIPEGNAALIECGHFRIVFRIESPAVAGLKAGHSTERNASNIGPHWWLLEVGLRSWGSGVTGTWFNTKGEISARAEYSVPRATAPFVGSTDSGENEPTSQYSRRGVDRFREAIQRSLLNVRPVFRTLEETIVVLLEVA